MLDSDSQQLGTGKLGASAVFLTAVSTILGAVLFLRFGYAVANVGLLGTLGIIVLGHLVTIPTAMAIAEIATNQRVAGGGAYHIISRSFGIVIGAAVGIALYFSQAISVAFYAIAFAESFRPWIGEGRSVLGLPLSDPRMISVPTTIALYGLIWWKGAATGVGALYAVVAVLFLSLIMFFLGSTGYDAGATMDFLTTRLEEPAGFFVVFAIIFPAFTGVAAGLGLSGDLRDPKRSIPIGTIAATAVGMFVYVLVAFKLAASAPPEELQDQFAMAKIAIWGPIIPIGLACATLSSALGSMLVAPRTLQALGGDRIWSNDTVNSWLRASAKDTGEPLNAALVTTLIALVFVVAGDVNFVAQIISMFFMVTYGAICLISLLEHFAADPSYRPAFRSRWYISLVGALSCIWCMFEMNALYAFLSILAMLGLYVLVAKSNSDRRGLTYMFQGAVFQISRKLQVFAQKSTSDTESTWRPSVVAISRNSFERLDEFELLRWISDRYGFGTYIHHVEGYLSKATSEQAAHDLNRLVHRADASRSNVYVDTLVCPSSTSLIAQLVQLPGISGKPNNMLLFGAERDSGNTDDLNDNFQMVTSAGFDVALLGVAQRGFGYRREIHVWITPTDFHNAPLLVLLAFIIVGAPDWSGGRIRVFAVTTATNNEEEVEEEERLKDLLRDRRLPISRDHVEVVSNPDQRDVRELVMEHSVDADLIMLGFRGEVLKRRGSEIFSGYEGLGNILFVNTATGVELERPEDPIDSEDMPEETDGTDAIAAADGQDSESETESAG